MATLYFVDGYHGGIDGHMPVGSWQDILDALERMPEWTVSLDVEPESYEWLKRNDFEVYCRLSDFVASPDGQKRMEFLNGCYGQPFCWAIDGESVIRQMVRGIAIIKRHFPTATVDTYSVQEPCFTSQLPQIIKKLGFERMSLKNSTCWGGYMAKMPGSIVRLHSPDGTWMPSVVRYECEELYDCCATDASGYDRKNIRTIADRCEALGIDAPNGMTYQDLGWLCQPMVEGFPVEFLTYRQYFEKFGHLLKGDVDFHQEDVLCALPWGTIELSETLGAVRALEYSLAATEKLMLAASPVSPVTEDIRRRLERAWDDTMSAQHHDAYICARSERWGEHVRVKTGEAGKLLSEIKSDILAAASENDFVRRAGEDEVYVRVYNTVATPGKGIASVRLGLPRGWADADVFNSRGEKVKSYAAGAMYRKFGYDEDGNLLSGDPVPKHRRYPDGTEEAIDLVFEADLPGIGYSTYRVAKLEAKKPCEFEPMAELCENGVAVRSDRWEVFFNAEKGGAITKLRDVTTGVDYAAEGPQGYIRGFFPEKGEMLDTLSCRAKIRVFENTPFTFGMWMRTEINGHELITTVRMTADDPRIVFETSADFTQDPECVGDPEVPPEGAPINYRRRSGYNEEPKLAAVFSVSGGEKRVFKAAPYDVCESRLGDGTSFIDWGEIKHNILNDYIDVCAEETGKGLGLWCDRVTGYSVHGDKVTLTMGFGGHVGFFWGDYKLSGMPTLGYAIYPHGGDTFEACTAEVFARGVEPITVTRLAGVPRTWDSTALSVENRAVKATGAIYGDEGWQIRLFNASPEDAGLGLKSDISGFGGEKCDLWGKPTGEKAQTACKFEIMTLR
ncbi:MAG: hypothetical protein IJY86_01655 [Clostridia bacterium]|nr:hypothetical protein [Clostridia bacterium]